MSVRCKITCIRVGCQNSAEWDDAAPSPGGGINRSPPDGWILRPKEPITGQLAERAYGICPECQRFALSFTADDPVSLWNRTLNVRAIEPGVFDVAQEDGELFGQVRLLGGGAFMPLGRDASADQMGVVAAKITQRFDFA